MNNLYGKLISHTTRSLIPLSVQIEVTRRCPLECVHCYVDKSSSYEMTTDILKDIIVQLSEIGTLFLNLTGGEIFLREDIIDIIEFAKHNNFHVRVVTSGFLFNRTIVKQLSKIRLDECALSIYSIYPEVHDRITGVDGSFNKTFEAINLLLEHGIQTNLNTVITKMNMKGTRELEALADKLKCFFSYDPIITSCEDIRKQNNEIRLNDKEIKRFYLSYPFSRRHLEYINRKNNIPTWHENADICRAARSICFIDSCGNVRPCLELRMNCGNIRKRKFSDIWTRSKNLKKIRGIKFKDMLFCKKCPFSMYCSPCPGVFEQDTGSPLIPSHRWCIKAKTTQLIMTYPEGVCRGLQS